MLAGVGIGHPAQAVAAAGKGRQAAQQHRFLRPPGLAAEAGVPLPLEQQLPVGDHRPVHFHHGFAPGAAVVVHRPEFVGGAGAADIGDLLVHHQDLAMVAEQVAYAGLPAQRVVAAELAAGLDQLLAPAVAQFQAAEAVEQAAHPHAAGAGIQQRVQQGLGAAAAFHQIEFQLHLPLGAGDAGEHAREEILSVAEQGEAVAAAPGKDRSAHREAKISTAPTGTDRPMLFSPASLRSLSTPGARPKSAASSTSGDSVTTWKRWSSRRVASTSAT
ncbi:hypothetical protein D9M70_405340 [compost metagenome]